ncbi:MAG: trehalose-phosphatase [Bdellovibrionales bacterium RBG_16_40_8]|nr:MAG: trehalose-phosphatase [Bdellovibrionales bacterium RBG_16_40_8]
MYLFSSSGLKILESLSFTKTLFAFDFDGTLSKIVKDPRKAKINESTFDLLQQLGQLAPIAVISGRGLDDLKSKFNSSVGYFVGNHGLEGINSESQKREVFLEFCVSWKTQLERSLKKESSPRGIEIEDKTYSIAVHYRKSRQKQLAKTYILESVSKMEPPPRIIMGKCVVNLVPTGGPHKGVALLELMLKSDTRSAFYIGDDDTDEDIFALSDSRLFTVRVGQKNKSHAKFFIRRQTQINLLLKTLISFLDSTVSKEKGESLGVHKHP